MSQNDRMKEWFKELPDDQPSPDFVVKVMQRVMSEWTSNPIKYQPIISRKGWWFLGLIAVLLTGFLLAIQASLDGSPSSAAQPNTIYGINLISIFEPASRIFSKLNSISPAVAVGALAILALWFFDQLFVKTVKR